MKNFLIIILLCVLSCASDQSVLKKQQQILSQVQQERKKIEELKKQMEKIAEKTEGYCISAKASAQRAEEERRIMEKYLIEVRK